MHRVAEKTYTPEDLLSIDDGKGYELVDGHLVERDMSQVSSWIGGRLYRFVDIFAEDHQSGWVWVADLGYECFPDAPGKIRKPDVSFIRRERMPDGPSTEGYAYIAPDLVAEIVSHNDLWHKVEEKVAEYLVAGVPLVWVIGSEVRSAYVYRRDGSVSRLREGDDLDGEDVLPGFRCPLASIFPAKQEPKQPA